MNYWHWSEVKLFFNASLHLFHTLCKKQNWACKNRNRERVWTSVCTVIYEKWESHMWCGSAYSITKLLKELTKRPNNKGCWTWNQNQRGKQRDRDFSTFKYQLSQKWLLFENVVSIVPYEVTVHVSLCMLMEGEITVVPTYIIYMCAFLHMTNWPFSEVKNRTILHRCHLSLQDIKAALQSTHVRINPLCCVMRNPAESETRCEVMCLHTLVIDV